MTFFDHDILGLIPVSTRSRKRDYLPNFYTLRITPIPPHKRIKTMGWDRMGFAPCVGLSQNNLFMAG